MDIAFHKRSNELSIKRSDCTLLSFWLDDTIQEDLSTGIPIIVVMVAGAPGEAQKNQSLKPNRRFGIILMMALWTSYLVISTKPSNQNYSI